MSALYIQVERDGEWRNVTTIKLDPKSHNSDADREYRRAFSEAERQLTGWSSYGGFIGMPLRIAEEMQRGGYREAKP